MSKDRAFVLVILAIVTIEMAIYAYQCLGLIAIIAPITMGIALGLISHRPNPRLWPTQEAFYLTLAEVIGSMMFLYAIAPFI